MALISIREYGKLRIDELDPPSSTVTITQARRLANLKQLHGFDVFKWVTENTISAQQYVGVVQIGTLTVEVLPKIDGINDTATRRNLVAMLAVAADLEIGEGDVARVATQNHGILEILIRLFCDKLFAQVHRGLIRRYEGHQENLQVLRGKLGVTQQIRLNTGNPERLFCHFDEFQEDNPLNQILKAAARLLLKISRDLTNQRYLTELLLILEGVSDISRHNLPLHHFQFDRLSERYRPSFQLAKLFLTNTPPDVSGGNVHGFSLFFEMNRLFEEYVGRIAARVFRAEGFRVKLQAPQRYLTFDETRCRDAFKMKPDVTGMLGQQTSWIIDTKWKELSPEESRDGVLQSDLYQMYAYSNCYDCPEVVLLYPHQAALGHRAGVRASYRLKSWAGSTSSGSAGRIRVATVDLTELKTVPTALRNLFNETSMTPSSGNEIHGRPYQQQPENAGYLN